MLTGGHARLLIFANQQDSSAGTSKATYGGAMFAVTAVNQRGRWQIENIDTFTGRRELRRPRGADTNL